MRRREFISVIVSATAWPLAARAQDPAMPVIGFLNATEAIHHLVAAFRRGLAEAGYVEGKNVTIEERFANFKLELLPQLAGDLVRRNVSVIFAPTPEAGAAAKNATTSISIVALDLESDPLAKGYVKSLARPGGNMTGMFLDLPELSGKQIGLLKEIVPRLSRIAIFGIPSLNAAQFAATETVAPWRRVRAARRLRSGICRSQKSGPRSKFQAGSRAETNLACGPWVARRSTPSSTGRRNRPSSYGVTSRAITNAAARADRDLRKIPSRIASPSTNGPSMSRPEPTAATGRVTSSFVSVHGQCSFSMSANRA